MYQEDDNEREYPIFILLSGDSASRFSKVGEHQSGLASGASASVAPASAATYQAKEDEGQSRDNIEERNDADEGDLQKARAGADSVVRVKESKKSKDKSKSSSTKSKPRKSRSRSGSSAELDRDAGRDDNGTGRGARTPKMRSSAASPLASTAAPGSPPMTPLQVAAAGLSLRVPLSPALAASQQGGSLAAAGTHASAALAHLQMMQAQAAALNAAGMSPMAMHHHQMAMAAAAAAAAGGYSPYHHAAGMAGQLQYTGTPIIGPSPLAAFPYSGLVPQPYGSPYQQQGQFQQYHHPMLGLIAGGGGVGLVPAIPPLDLPTSAAAAAAVAAREPAPTTPARSSPSVTTAQSPMMAPAAASAAPMSPALAAMMAHGNHLQRQIDALESHRSAMMAAGSHPQLQQQQRGPAGTDNAPSVSEAAATPQATVVAAPASPYLPSAAASGGVVPGQQLHQQQLHLPPPGSVPPSPYLAHTTSSNVNVAAAAHVAAMQHMAAASGIGLGTPGGLFGMAAPGFAGAGQPLQPMDLSFSLGDPAAAATAAALAFGLLSTPVKQQQQRDRQPGGSSSRAGHRHSERSRRERRRSSLGSASQDSKSESRDGSSSSSPERGRQHQGSSSRREGASHGNKSARRTPAAADRAAGAGVAAAAGPIDLISAVASGTQVRRRAAAGGGGGGGGLRRYPPAEREESDHEGRREAREHGWLTGSSDEEAADAAGRDVAAGAQRGGNDAAAAGGGERAPGADGAVAGAAPQTVGIRKYINMGEVIRLALVSLVFFQGAGPEKMYVIASCMVGVYLYRVGLIQDVQAGMKRVFCCCCRRNQADEVDAGRGAAAIRPVPATPHASWAAVLMYGRGWLPCDLVAMTLAFFVSLLPTFVPEVELQQRQ